MRIYFDVTHAHRARHSSGLLRVSRRLLDEMQQRAECEIVPCVWKRRKCAYVEESDRIGVTPGPGDRLLVPSLFSELERPGFTRFITDTAARTCAVFHDAIPLKDPETAWPDSVTRHPFYMKALSGFDRVLAVSDHSRRELLGYWRWVGAEDVPVVDTIRHGANFDALPRRPPRVDQDRPPVVLSVGILEPRKDQTLLLDVCDQLWADGRQFELRIVGRTNPHHGKPIVRRIKDLRRAGRAVEHLSSVNDAELRAHYERAQLTVFASRSEGCGLPVVESLWMGVPCVCSDIPPVRELSRDGGCLEFTAGCGSSLRRAVEHLLAEPSPELARLGQEIESRILPTWADTAQDVLAVMADSTTGGASRPISGKMPSDD